MATFTDADVQAVCKQTCVMNGLPETEWAQFKKQVTQELMTAKRVADKNALVNLGVSVTGVNILS